MGAGARRSFPWGISPSGLAGADPAPGRLLQSSRPTQAGGGLNWDAHGEGGLGYPNSATPTSSFCPACWAQKRQSCPWAHFPIPAQPAQPSGFGGGNQDPH